MIIKVKVFQNWEKAFRYSICGIVSSNRQAWDLPLLITSAKAVCAWINLRLTSAVSANFCEEVRVSGAEAGFEVESGGYFLPFQILKTDTADGGKTLIFVGE